jgi:hypothetical protein
MNSAILFSGGWDSFFCAIKAIKNGERPTLIFFDYGQPYLDAEEQASSKLASTLGVPRAVVKLAPLGNKAGIFANRNETFIREVAAQNFSKIYFGSRNLIPAFDRYKDSNWVWARDMAAKYSVKVETPVTMLPKWYIKLYCIFGVGKIVSSSVFSTEGLS